MASGAGLNRVGSAGGVTLLALNPTSTAVANPAAAYGNTGNDSYEQIGPLLVEGIGFTKVGFQIIPALDSTSADGYTVTIYYTNDSRAYAQWGASFNPERYRTRPGGAPTVPAQAWSLAPAQSDQSGTGTDTNPMIMAANSPAPALQISRGVVAVRAVLTSTSTPTGACRVIAFAVP